MSCGIGLQAFRFRSCSGPKRSEILNQWQQAESCGTVKSHADVDEDETTRILDP